MRSSLARQAQVEAQAKVNLFLRVLAREESGFHQIETLFCRVGLTDRVVVKPTAGKRSLECFGPDVSQEALGPTEQNLAWRAATAYAEATGFPAGFEVIVEKRIPVGGGLGGGSADAGGVLRALNALNPVPLPEAALLAIGAQLGADVPFLTQNRSVLALGWGRGDRLLVLPPLPASAVWLLFPRVRVRTADAYRWIDEVLQPQEAATYSVDQLSTWSGIAVRSANDFEPVVAARIPVIGRLLSTLRAEELRHLLGPSSIVLMSGSGSTIAVVAGQRPPQDIGPPPSGAGVTILETETATFVEPVVLTH